MNACAKVRKYISAVFYSLFQNTSGVAGTFRSGFFFFLQSNSILQSSLFCFKALPFSMSPSYSLQIRYIYSMKLFHRDHQKKEKSSTEQEAKFLIQALQSQTAIANFFYYRPSINGHFHYSFNFQLKS